MKKTLFTISVYPTIKHSKRQLPKMPAELKIQVRFLLGALLETTRKRGFLCAQANLYAVSYNTALGALLEKIRSEKADLFYF